MKIKKTSLVGKLPLPVIMKICKNICKMQAYLIAVYQMLKKYRAQMLEMSGFKLCNSNSSGLQIIFKDMMVLMKLLT